VSASDTALAGRQLATSLMTDRCTIGRPGGQIVNPDTGAVTDAVTDFYAGACRVKPITSVQAGEAAAGERVIVMRSYTVTVPMAQAGVRVGDVVTVTACQLDPALTGTVLRVRDIAKGSQITARRLVCEEQET
jgi:hypothetical protein